MMAGALLLALLALVGALVVRLLRRKDADDESKFQIEMLWMKTDGKSVDKPACVLFVALGVASAILIFDTLTGQQSDSEFSMYLTIFVIPSLGSIVKDAVAAFAPAQPEKKDAA